MALACEGLVADAAAKTRGRTAAQAATTAPVFLLLMKRSLRDERDSGCSTRSSLREPVNGVQRRPIFLAGMWDWPPGARVIASAAACGAVILYSGEGAAGPELVDAVGGADEAG